MNTSQFPFYRKAAVMTTALLTLSACGGGSDKPKDTDKPNEVIDGGSLKPEAQTISLSGTATTAKPISGAKIIAKCKKSVGFTTPVTTNSDGQYSGKVPKDTLPCALQVNAKELGTQLHSFASKPGINNISPLTDMIIATATNGIPKDWFDNGQPIDISSKLEEASNKVISALRDSGYSIPSNNLSPFNDQSVSGDSFSKLLEQIQVALEASPNLASYLALITLIKDGNFEAIPSLPQTGGGSTGGGSTGGGIVGSGNASQCWSSSFTKPQTTKMTFLSKNNDIETRTVTETKSDGLVTFKGESFIKTTNTPISTQVGDGELVLDSESKTTDYLLISEADFTMSTAYSEFESDLGVYTFSKLVSSDGSLGGNTLNFNLSPGESFSRSWTSNNTYGLAKDNLTGVVSTVRTQKTVTYKGVEAITTVAGTFDACRFDEVTTTTDSDTPDGPSTFRGSTWYMVGTGYVLRLSVESVDTNITSGRFQIETESIIVNGEKVIGQ